MEDQKLKTIIAVMGGGVKKYSDGVWRSPDFSEGVWAYGAPGSRERVEAAGILFRDYPDSAVAALGGKGQMKDIPDAPTLAEVLKRELMEFGVPEEKIIEEKVSGTTYEQLLALKQIAENASVTELLVVSNRHHLPRIEAMLTHAPVLAGMSGLFSITLQQAEEVLLKHDSEHWKTIIDTAYASREMADLMKNEMSGVRQIEAGTYTYKKL